MKSITVIGGATEDIYFISSEYNVEDDKLKLIWGEKLVADDLHTSIGGGGANAAVSLARLGINSRLVSQVGDDNFGRRIKHMLDNEGVDLTLFKIRADCKTSTSALLTIPNKDHTIVMYRGSNDDLNFPEKEKDLLFDTDWLYITDLAGESKTMVEQLAAEAKKNGVKVAFIPGQHQLDRGIGELQKILKNTDIFILNLWEAGKLLNTKIEYSPQNVDECGKFKPTVDDFVTKFHNMGAKLCVITKDICGVTAYDGKETYSVAAPETTVVDTTGAGDAFSSGFIAAIAEGENINKALEQGSENAGSVIAHYGAQTGLISHD